MVNWITIDLIVVLILFIQCGIIIFQQINHASIQSKLLNRLMAKNYGELVQSDVLLKDNKNNDMIQVRLPEEDNDPHGVDMLNKIL